jgi:hypothetical protein
VRNLQTELLRILDEVVLDCAYRERFLWVLGLGGMAAEGKSERAWYVVRFRMIAHGLGFGSWWEAKRVLEGVLWMRELDEPGRRLWVEAGDVLLDRGFEEWLQFC